MAKVTEEYDKSGTVEACYFECPGCGEPHYLAIRPNTLPNGAGWTYNGNPDSPTFSPSILRRVDRSRRSEPKPDVVCHSFVTDGKIQFLGDCTHALVNQTIDLPEVDE